VAVVDRAGSSQEQTQPGGQTEVPSKAPPEGLLEIGFIAKPHGLRGEVIVALLTNRDERVAPGSVLVARDGSELTIVRSSAHKERFIVQFEGVNGIDAASALRATTLFAAPLEDPDVLWVHDLVGAEVVDRTGQVLGTVESVQSNPASDLLVLSGGALVPLRFVVDHVPGATVVVDVPDGIFDLG
jgi:16S rRNA processing protein RimM